MVSPKEILKLTFERGPPHETKNVPRFMFLRGMTGNENLFFNKTNQLKPDILIPEHFSTMTRV